MRGLKSIDTAIQFTDGWLVRYNYLRAHKALAGKTPAQKAGVVYPFKDWADITRLPTATTIRLPRAKERKMKYPEPEKLLYREEGQ